ncbi:MAG TPA: 50S ribosomal protein L4 [Candidatus Lokiarchaeia archaeon]|nr:50S ribosomal protein L4 [Candidatus Lokiarchaeia archaeon]
MNGQVRDIEGTGKKTIELGPVFETPYRPDVILKVVAATQSTQKQPQGRDPLAGKRTTAITWGPGRGKARVPRVKGAGTGASSNAAFAPGTVGGRLAHPPRAEKILYKKINKKEKELALESAIAATTNNRLLKERGHKIEKLDSPILIFDDKIQTIRKTKSLIELLEKVGLKEELERVGEKKIRPGKEKRRGMKYRVKKGPLIVAENLGLYDAARNITGLEVTSVNKLCVEHLAPGGLAGRLVIWTESAINAINQKT